MEPFPLIAGDVARATGGTVVAGDAGRDIGSISIDSRTLAAGDFFIPIRGERFDGHAFVADALARGASGVMVDTDAQVESGGAVLIRVGDTTQALQDLARDVRQRAEAKVVAITGSAGKTTTKEVAAEFLSIRYRVFRNQGNLNNHIGLPLSLLELRTRPDIAVVELGMNHPGEIRTLVGIAQPDIRVWTNVGDAHLGFFESADAIADAKAEILEQARPDDVLVANANDTRVMSRASTFAGRVVTFGLETEATVRATNVELRGLEGSTADVRTPSGKAHVTTPLLGFGNLANVLAATAVAIQFGIPITEIARRAATLRPARHRGELVQLTRGIRVVDDSYNSSPAALKRALQTIGAATGSIRKLAVLGEMLELGAHAVRLHEECGRTAANAGLDVLITVGGDPARAMADAAIAAGMESRSVQHVATKEEAAGAVLALVQPGDLLLVKGSRGIGTDLVVERLKAEFA